MVTKERRATPDGGLHTVPARTGMYVAADRGLSAPMEADIGPPAMNVTAVPTPGGALSAHIPPVGHPAPAQCQDALVAPEVAPLCPTRLADHPLVLAVKDTQQPPAGQAAPTAAGPPAAPLPPAAYPSTPASGLSSAVGKRNANKRLRQLPVRLEQHHLLWPGVKTRAPPQNPLKQK